MKNSHPPYTGHPAFVITQNTDQYQVLIDQSHHAFLVTQANGHIIASNEAAVQLFGYTHIEFKALTQNDIVSQQPNYFHLQQQKNELAKTIATGTAKDGQQFAVETFSVPFFNTSGEPLHSTLITRISEPEVIKEFKQVFDSITDGFFTVNSNWVVTYWNKEVEHISGIAKEAILGKYFWDFYNNTIKKTPYSKYKSALRYNTSVQFEEYYEPGNVWLEVNIYPFQSGLSIFFKNITESHRLKELERIEKTVLENNTRANSNIETTLQYYLKEIEKIHPGMICSVLQLKGDQLFNWSSPSLSKNYISIIDGAVIGSNVGSCGTAAYKKEKVIVTDIEHDTRWADYKTFALTEGLRACWSYPIINSKGAVLGTFAIYYKQVKSPAKEEEKTIIRANNLLVMILENKMAAAAMQLSNERYNLVVKATKDLVWDWELKTGKIYRSGSGLAGVYGHSSNNKIESLQSWSDYLHPEDKDKVLEQLQYFINSKKQNAFKLEYRFKRENGLFSYINDRGYILRDESGKAIRLIGAAEDITERKNTERAIQESEQRYKMFVQQSTEGIWRIELPEPMPIHTPLDVMIDTWQRHSFVAECNDVFAKMYGFKNAGEIIGKPLHQIMPGDEEGNRLFMTNFVNNGFKISEELSYEVDKYGKQIIFVNNMVGIIENDCLQRTWGTQRNITEQVKIEQALSASETLLRTIVQTEPECISLIDEQGQLLQINAAGLAMTEADSAEQVLHKKVAAVLHPRYRAAFAQLIQDVFNDQRVKLSFEITGFKGTRRWLEMHAVPLKDASGNIIAALGVTRDVTENKKSEVLLKSSEENYRYLFNNNPSAITIWDTETLQIVEVNETAIELYGYEREEFLQMNVLDMYPQKEQYVFSELINQARADNLSKKTMRWYHLTKNGLVIIMEVSSHTITYNGKKAVLALGNNVTEKVQLENSLLQERKIRQKQITDAVITGQEKERVEIGQELHDNINQILATTKLYLECALEQKSFGPKLINESKLLTEKAMAEIRRLSHSLLPPSLEEIGLLEALHDLTENLRSVHALKIINNWVGFAENVLNKKLKLTIFRIVQEQLNNVIKHAGATKAQIHITQKEDQIFLIIEDNGIGFDTTKKRTGVGIKNIISRSEVNNGKVNINSKPGEGCVLTVCFTVNDL